MKIRNVIISLAAVAACSCSVAQADTMVYAGYLNNLSSAPNPADIPNPFNTATYFIGTGGVTTPHDTGVLRFLNTCPVSVTIDKGLKVTTQKNVYQLWDSFLGVTLAPGQDLVLSETSSQAFDTSEGGLGINPVVSGFVNGIGFSFIDTSRILLGHEDTGNFTETTPYGLLGAIPCPSGVPDGSATMSLLGIALAGIEAFRRRFGQRQ